MTHKITQLLTIVCLFSGIGWQLQAQDLLWEKSLGGIHADYLMDAQPTADYGFILAGSSLSKKTGNKSQGNNGDLDYWVWKMKENGDLDWQKNFGGKGADLLQSIALTRDGGFILAGTSASPGAIKGKTTDFDKEAPSRGGTDFWIIKLDASGTIEWQKTIGGSGQESLQKIQITKDGGYIIGGSSSSNISGEKKQNGFGNMDYWVVKLDNKGNLTWQKTFGGSYNDELRSIETTFDGGYIVGGYSNSPASGNKTDDNKGIGDFWILKLDEKGEMQWQKTLGGSQDDQLYVAHQTLDGNYILGGNSNSGTSNEKSKNNSNGTDIWLVKLDTSGKILWQETYDYGKVDLLTSLVENEDHTVLLGGFAQGESTAKTKVGLGGKQKTQKGTDDYIVLKISETGTVLWDKIVGSDGVDVLKKVIETRDGGYLLAGTSNPYSASGTALSSSTKSGGKLKKVQGNNEQVSNVKNQLNDAIKEETTAATNTINDTSKELTNEAKKAIGLTDASPLKMASPVADLGGSVLNGGSGAGGSGSNGKQGTEKKLPASRDKKYNYGSADFWVVKLKDKSKPEKVKVQIEALPNPTQGFTNIIVGYDFESGTASVFDLGGRQLQSFPINSRTVPIDLSSLPEGIYVVNIKTNVHSDGVKVIKGINKN